MRTVIIAANPKSGSKSRLELVEQLAQLLLKNQLEVHVEFDLKSLEQRIVEQADRETLSTVVAAGGDGTVNAVATRTPPHVPITVLPLGSENLLAKHYGWDLSPEACANRIMNGTPVILDAMEINGRLGLIMVSMGFDSEVVRLVHANRKSHITRWAYRMQALNAWLTYRWPAHEIRYRKCDSATEELVHGQWVFVFNIPKYATDLHIMKDADPSDGLLDLGVFTKSGPFRGIWQYLDVLRGRHRQRADWFECRVTELHCEKVNGTDDKLHSNSSYQFDGDSGGATPMHIRVLAKRIKLLT